MSPGVALAAEQLGRQMADRVVVEIRSDGVPRFRLIDKVDVDPAALPLITAMRDEL